MTATLPSRDPRPHTATDADPVVSYLTLRRVVGLLGVSLPVLLITWGFVFCACTGVQDSLSDYYALRTRDLLVGTLVGIGLFLLTYRGYDRRDDVAGNLAFVAAVGTALFPNSGAPWERGVHFVSAAALFLVLSYFSLFLFTKSGGDPTPRKRVRNRVYRASGVVMLACLGAISAYFAWWQETAIASLHPVLWLETLLLWAFGVSWFVKGETLWTDRG